MAGYDNLDLLEYLVSRLKKIRGKKALQKIMYFLNEVIGRPYTFRWWKYGPFSKELYDDMDLLLFMGKMEYDPDGPEITISKFIERSQIPPEIEKRIDVILRKLEEFTDYKPFELELLASVHFLRNYAYDLEKKDDVRRIRWILNIFKGDKKYTEGQVKRALKQVKELEKLMKKWGG